ncbi:MAG: monovalent cation:proton antiporter-2 (CPA2) family protein [Pseudomonadota bacterium]
MATSDLLLDAVVLMGGAAIAAPVFKRIGLGTVLGYLALGVILGPILNYIRDGEEVLHFAELGVVLLLFVVGLELNPSRLWTMRREIFGLGAAQVFLTGFLLAAFAYLSNFAFAAALLVGFGLALSSTAFALQILEEERSDNTPYGKRAFSILLFQDLAIAPLLVAVPLLAAGTVEMSEASFVSLGIAVAAVAVLLVSGRYLLNPLFGIIAATGAREAMIAAALFIVIGAALLMQYAGLSMAMGAFIAGVLLSESRYRHELEADIEPFRGILLGLFFIAVGLAVDLAIVWDNIVTILWFVPAAMALKAAVLYGLSRAFGSSHNDAIRVAMLLPQFGEFGFILFSAGLAVGLLSAEQSSFLIACVTLSMALTPLTTRLGLLLQRTDAQETMDETFEGAHGASVLMVGFSRMGQIASQALLAGGCDVTILDNDPQRIRQAERFGFRIYFGDGTRKDVLRAAGIEQAQIVAVCTNDRTVTNKIVELVASDYPNAKIYARSYDRAHALDLLKRPGVWQIRETFESAIVMGEALLVGLGQSPEDARLIVKDVRRRDKERLDVQRRDGLMAGQEQLHTAPVPEPLLQPRRVGLAIDENTQSVLENATSAPSSGSAHTAAGPSRAPS